MRLDLHGVRHYRAELEVENFVLLNQGSVPLTIICGNSQRMIAIVEDVLKKIEPARWEQVRWGVFKVYRV
jgi:hypothetical protein